MKKLNSKARTTETADTASRLLRLFDTETTLKNEAYLKPLFAEMQTVADRMTEAIRQDKALSDLEDADATRDEILTNLFKIVEGYAASPLDSLRLPAGRLSVVLEKFGPGMTREPYAEESSLIEALLTDLEAPELAGDIAGLQGVTQTLDLLRDAQSDFTAKRVTYEREKSTQKAGDKASVLKKPLLDLINVRLLPYVGAMKMADAGKYSAFADAAAQVVADTNTAVKSRSRRNKDDEDPPAP